MEGNTSSDDDEIRNIENQIDFKATKKRKEVPPASVPEIPDHDQYQVPIPVHEASVPHIEVHNHTHEEQHQSSGRRNKDNIQNMNFPWLELVGPTCHSVKQAKSGLDLTHVKKKYRNMRCLTCAQYNPSTPWAELWPRKFELQTLVDHAKSGAHVKSETSLKSMPDYAPPSELSLQQQSFKVVSGSGKALQLDKTVKEDNNHPEAMHAAAPMDASGFGELPTEEEGQLAGKASVRIRGVQGAGGTHIVAHSTRIRPDWLYSEGSLCLSDKQVADPNLPPSTKKKYKQMACLYCREYVSDSMWAHLRPRKFESAVIGDHERSAVHQKALELRNAHLSGATITHEAQQLELEMMRNAQDMMRSTETIKFAEY